MKVSSGVGCHSEVTRNSTRACVGPKVPLCLGQAERLRRGQCGVVWEVFGERPIDFNNTRIDAARHLCKRRSKVGDGLAPVLLGEVEYC